MIAKKSRTERSRSVPDRGGWGGACFAAARRPEEGGGIARVIVPVRYKALLLQEDCH
jgi:hypothetical protein